MFNFRKPKPINFLAIGAMVVDDFIFLQDASVHCKLNHDECELCMRFGDKIPYKDHQVLPAVGNAANASVSAARLGLTSALVTYIGDDDLGAQSLQHLQSESVLTDFVVQEKGKITNLHYVLSYEADRTILIRHEAYHYDFAHLIANLKKRIPQWIYFSSVASHTEAYHDALLGFLSAHPESKLVFQPGTFQLSLGLDGLAGLYKKSEVVVVNVEEAQGLLKTDSRDYAVLLKGLAATGAKIVCVTDGPDGASMFDTQTNELYFMPIYPDPAPPVERTGCGDAFASTFSAYLAMGKTPVEALLRAPINPMSVVQHVGAQQGLLSVAEIEELLAKAPADYRPRRL